jgi:hypothetical protein
VVKVGNAKRRWQENPVPPIRLEDVVPPEERMQPPSASVDDTTSSPWSGDARESGVSNSTAGCGPARILSSLQTPTAGNGRAMIWHGNRLIQYPSLRYTFFFPFFPFFSEYRCCLRRRNICFQKKDPLRMKINAWDRSVKVHATPRKFWRKWIAFDHELIPLFWGNRRFCQNDGTYINATRLGCSNCYDNCWDLYFKLQFPTLLCKLCIMIF